MHVDIVLIKLSGLKFTINAKIYAFAKPEIKYRSHLISSCRHVQCPENVCGIESIEACTTKTTLKSVVGLFNYYHDYIKNFVEVNH